MKKNLIQWICYSLMFMILLIPFLGITLKLLSGGIILGFFGGILNNIRTKLSNK